MDKNIQQPICQCKRSDAGRCAKDLGLDAIACRCACHVLQQPSVEDERELSSDANEVLAEVRNARNNWPPFNTAHEGFAVLLEEVDELKSHVWTNQKRRDLAAMRKEAMQVAAMALRFMGECCDEATGRK